MQIGDKCFLKGEFTHIFYIADFNSKKTKVWIISNENGNPLGWVSTSDIHFGNYFGPEMAEGYAKLLED